MNASSTLTAPTVAVIIPAANAARTIAQTLNSVLAQSFAASQIVIVDDGSTDQTASIVQTYEAIHPHLRLLVQARSGPSEARNAAIRATSARYLAPIDADDIWHPDFLKTCVTALEANPDAGMAYAWHHLIDPFGRTTRGPMEFTTHGGAFGPLLLTNFVGNGSSAVMRRDILEAAGGYSAPLADWHGAEDYLLQLRLAARAPVVCVNRDLVAYRRSNNSLSSDYGAAFRGRLAAVRCALNEFGPAPAKVERWVRGDACRTYAFQLIAQRQWLRAVIMVSNALRADPQPLARDILIRMRNLKRRWAGTGAGTGAGIGSVQRIDGLLSRRLAQLARSLPLGRECSKRQGSPLC